MLWQRASTRGKKPLYAEGAPIMPQTGRGQRTSGCVAADFLPDALRVQARHDLPVGRARRAAQACAPQHTQQGQE